MQEYRFDTLARSLAQGTSLCSALKLFGAFIGGSLLASLERERTTAQGISDAAHFCQSLPPGPIRGQCVDDAAHGTGLFVQCQGDINRLCPGNGPPTCCATGQTCSNGTCSGRGASCTTDSDCAPGAGCSTNATSGVCVHIRSQGGFCACGFPVS